MRTYDLGLALLRPPGDRDGPVRPPVPPVRAPDAWGTVESARALHPSGWVARGARRVCQLVLRGARLALLGLVLAGCASAVASCVPEGVAPRAAWQIALAAPVPQCQGCVAAWYRAGDQSLGVLWVRGLLARVDSDPRDLRAPVWEDPGIVVPGTGFEARADPVQTCRWRPWAPRSF